MVKYGGVEFPHSSTGQRNGIKGVALTNKKEKIVKNTVHIDNKVKWSRLRIYRKKIKNIYFRELEHLKYSNAKTIRNPSLGQSDLAISIYSL
jgi:hypothetical protein